MLSSRFKRHFSNGEAYDIVARTGGHRSRKVEADGFVEVERYVILNRVAPH